MLTCYFGVPGVGKTTIGTKIAQRELKRIKKGRSPYSDVFTNFYCEGCKKIEFNVFKNYKCERCLIILDEITLDADNRDYKNFDNRIRDFLILHRHFGVDIIYLTQNYQFVDKKVRELTQELWYMTKSPVPILRQFTVCRRVFRNININEYTSELVLGYRFCNLIERFFTRNVQIIYRKPYYKYFDSFDEGDLAFRPTYDAPIWQQSTEETEEDIQQLSSLLS